MKSKPKSEDGTRMMEDVEERRKLGGEGVGVVDDEKKKESQRRGSK
jgi:hypothetical protein